MEKVYYLIPFALLLTVNIIYIVNQNTFVSLFRGDYLIYGMIVIFGFYFARKLGSLYLKRIATVNSSNATINPQLVYNLSASAVFLIIHLVYHVLNNSFNISINFALQSFSLMLIPLLMLYNGTRGYSGLGWRISYYLFFPVHLLLLALIFLLGLYF